MSRVRLLLVVATLVSVGALIPTGAVPLAATEADTVSGDVVVRPAEGPNGDYAILNEDDEIELLLTSANPNVEGAGISPDSVTPLANVFTMRYTGDGVAEVWLTDQAEDVRFFHGDDPAQSIEGSENKVAVESGQTIHVGLLVDTRGAHDVEQIDGFVIHARVPESSDGNDADEDDETTDTSTRTPTPTVTLTATPTPTATGSPTPTPTATPTAKSSGSSVAGGTTRTQTATATDGSPSAPTDAPADPPGGGDPTEIGGIGIGQLVGVLAALLALLIALLARRYT